MGDFQDYIRKDRQKLLDAGQLHENEVPKMYNVELRDVYSTDSDITMIYNKFETTSYEERLKYYFQDHNMLEAKAQKYSTLGREEDQRLNDFAAQHTNRSASKRKKRSREAAKLFRKAEAKEQALLARRKDRKKPSRRETYKLQSEIMALRLEGMQKTAIVKSTDENDEKYNDAKARLKCYTLLFENAMRLDNEKDREKELRSLNKKINAAKRDMQKYGENRQATKTIEQERVFSDDFQNTLDIFTKDGEDTAYWERKKIERKKRLDAGHPANFGVKTLDELNKSKKGAVKNPLFNEKSYGLYKNARQQNQQFSHPDLMYYYNPKKYFRYTLDISRVSGCMLRPVNYDENWQPVSEQDKINHQFNLQVAKLVSDVSEGNEDADRELDYLMKNEMVRLEQEGPRLPSPEQFQKEFVDVYKKAKQDGTDLSTIEIPFLEEMLKNPAAACEFGARGLAEDGLLKFCPGVKQFLKENEKIDGYISAGGMLAKMVEVYSMTRYGFSIQTGGNAEVVSNGSEKQPQAALEAFLDMYKGHYDRWQNGGGDED